MIKQSIQRLGFLFRKLTQRKLDVLDQLEEDHIRVEMLFLQWRIARGEVRKRQVFDQIKRALVAHMHKEQSMFYPACSKIGALKPLIAEGFEEHRAIKLLVKEISDLSMTAERTEYKMRTLLKEVEHHVNDEENDLFPQVRKLMKKGQFNKLSREIRASRVSKPAKTTKTAA